MYKPELAKERVFSRKEENLKRKDLRKKSTPAESVLWNAFRSKQVEGLRFRRQHSIGPYIMDFFCPSIKLCVELDGDVHNRCDENIKDEIRTKYINEQGVTILRFSNSCVYQSLNGIVESIKNYKQNPTFMEGWHKDEFIKPISICPLEKAELVEVKKESNQNPLLPSPFQGAE